MKITSLLTPQGVLWSRLEGIHKEVVEGIFDGVHHDRGCVRDHGRGVHVQIRVDALLRCFLRCC